MYYFFNILFYISILKYIVMRKCEISRMLKYRDMPQDTDGEMVVIDKEYKQIK